MPRFAEFREGVTEACLTCIRHVGAATFATVLVRGRFNDYLLLRCEVTQLICMCPVSGNLMTVLAPIDEATACMRLLHTVWDERTGVNSLLFTCPAIARRTS